MKIKLLFTIIIAMSVVLVLSCNKNQAGIQKSKENISNNLAVTDQSVAFMKSFGGDKLEIAKGMIATADAGFVMAGYTTSKGAGGSDAYLVKINGQGDVSWNVAYGQADNDAFYSVARSSDGGYVGAGKIENGAYKDKNMYIVKTGSNGQPVWERSFGGVKDEEANFIIATRDEGYIVAGLTASKGAGNGDAWIVKLSRTGDILWDKAYGTPENDFANAIVETADGGYAFAGFTGDKTDILVMKLDSKGEMVWNKFIGTANYESANSIIELADGSLVVGGVTQEKPNSKVDAYVVKISAKGDLVWSKAIRRENFSSVMDIKQTPDGGFITCGTIVSGTKEAGGGDVYILKLSGTGDLEWNKVIGGPDIEYGNVIVPTAGNMYMFAGYIGYIDPEKAGNFDILYGKF